MAQLAYGVVYNTMAEAIRVRDAINSLLSYPRTDSSIASTGIVAEPGAVGDATGYFTYILRNIDGTPPRAVVVEGLGSLNGVTYHGTLIDLTGQVQLDLHTWDIDTTVEPVRNPYVSPSRVRGRQGSCRFRTTAQQPSAGSGWTGGGPTGALAMTRIAVIRPIRRLPTQAGQFTPIWMRSNGTTQGWWIWLNAGQPYAAVHGNVGQSLATYSATPEVGRWSTVCMTTAVLSAGGTAAVAGMNGALSVSGVSAGTSYTAGGTHAVGVNSTTPTISASEVEVYALLGSDTVALDAGTYWAAHAAIVNALERGQSLAAMFSGQTTLYDGRDLDASGTWSDQLGGASALTAFGTPERCFSQVKL